MDTSNQFHLWVFLPEDVGGEWPPIPVGYTDHDVADKKAAEMVFPQCTQRTFEDGFLAGFEDQQKDSYALQKLAEEVKNSNHSMKDAIEHALKKVER